MGSIILVRHGETALNAARVLQPANTPLSERGLRQAAALSSHIATLGVAATMSSDLTRALQTAQAICGESAHSIEQSALLQERNFGDLRGHAYDALDFDPLTMQQAPAGGESMPVFEARVAQALSLLCRRSALLNGPLLVVTHGLVIQTMLTRHLQLADGEVRPHKLGNTSLTIFDSAAPHRVSLLNYTSHLSDDLREDARAIAGI